jgi:6-phosphogluconolactonase
MKSSLHTAAPASLVLLVAALTGCVGNGTATGCGSNCPPLPHEFLFAGSAGTVEALKVDTATGALGPPVSTAGPQTAGGMVVDPAAKFLYVSDLNNPTIDVFSISAGNSTLSAAGSFTCNSNCGCAQAIACFVVNLAMAPSGQFLYAIQTIKYSNFCCFSNIVAWSVHSSTGALTFVGAVSAGFRPAQMAIDPAGKYLYAPDPGNANGSIYCFNIDPVSGALTAMPSSPFDSFTPAPYGVAVHPSGKFLYTALFFGFAIQPYTINPNTGGLTAIASSTTTTDNVAFLAMDPQGKFLYSGSNSGIDVFTIDSTSGLVSQLAGNPSNPGNFSWGIVLDPSGNVLYSADNVSSVRTFRVNRNTGALSQLGSPVAVGKDPLFLAIAE